jgi:FkbM family methyltransferase
MGRLKSLARIPILAPALRSLYYKLVHGEGRARPIRNGPLAGMKYYRYRWSTPREDLVENNWADPCVGAFAQLIKGKKRFFDIGANWGFYTLLAHRHRDPGCQIIAFEPNARSAAELKTQLQLNHVDHAQVAVAAVSDRIGTMEFVDTGSAIGQLLAEVDHHFVNAKRVTVQTTTLDAAAEQFGPPDLIKIDVEGAENLVLDGGRTVLTHHRPTLLAEIHGEEASRGFYDRMAAHNYATHTPEGVEVTDRTYHHELVCKPR